jgi:hypothetical protein
VGISFLKVKRRDDAVEEVDNTVVKGGGQDKKIIIYPQMRLKLEQYPRI